jgi:hypothetical protein
LKLGIFVHSKRPKISVKEVIKVFQSVNIPYSNKDPDIAIVIEEMVRLAITAESYVFPCYL